MQKWTMRSNVFGLKCAFWPMINSWIFNKNSKFKGTTSLNQLKFKDTLR